MTGWPEPVERVGAFLRLAGAEARLEELPTETATAAEAADAVGCVLGQIVKSLVVLADGAPAVVLVPGDRRMDTGKVARLLGARRVTVASAADVLASTGFAPGAVAPFPLENVESVLVERRLLRHETLWAGAGSERHLVSLSPDELVRLTRGRVEDVVLESP